MGFERRWIIANADKLHGDARARELYWSDAPPLPLAPRSVEARVPLISTPGDEPLPHLVRISDVVCRIRVSTLDRNPSADDIRGGVTVLSSWIANAEVLRNYKGIDDTKRLQIPFMRPSMSSNWMIRLEAGSLALVFLKQNQNQYEFADRQFGALEASDFCAPAVEGADPLRALQQDLLASLRDKNVGVLTAMVRQLGNLRLVDSAPSIEALLPSDDDILMGTALLALLRIGHTARLEEAARFAEDPAHMVKNVRPSRPEFLPYIVSGIALEIESLREVALAPRLERLLTSPDNEIRRAASVALSRIQEEGP